MSWATDSLAAFKGWLGATTATDEQLTKALELALATVETWLDRPLEKAERTQEDFTQWGPIRLRAWPVETVASITASGQAVDVARIYLDKRTGRLWPCVGGPVVTVYTGGFQPMPVDLELALWTVARELVPVVMSAAGVDQGETVRRVTTPDVGTIEYATPSTTATQAELLGGMLPAAVESLLARYRAEGPVGGA